MPAEAKQPQNQMARGLVISRSSGTTVTKGNKKKQPPWLPQARGCFFKQTRGDYRLSGSTLFIKSIAHTLLFVKPLTPHKPCSLSQTQEKGQGCYRLEENV